MMHPVVDCMAGLFDRQVYGIEIEFARTRRRHEAVTQSARPNFERRIRRRASVGAVFGFIQ
jgi:hypothetical protein